jgi:hypothetical protein
MGWSSCILKDWCMATWLRMTVCDLFAQAYTHR